MQPEDLAPSPWAAGPGQVRIRLEPAEVNRIPRMNEAVIVKEIAGLTFEAPVPAHTLDKNDGWVPAQYAGRIDGKVVFYLPTSNEGRPTWLIPEEALAGLLLDRLSPL